MVGRYVDSKDAAKNDGDFLTLEVFTNVAAVMSLNACISSAFDIE